MNIRNTNDVQGSDKHGPCNVRGDLNIDDIKQGLRGGELDVVVRRLDEQATDFGDHGVERVMGAVFEELGKLVEDGHLLEGMAVDEGGCGVGD